MNNIVTKLLGLKVVALLDRTRESYFEKVAFELNLNEERKPVMQVI